MFLTVYVIYWYSESKQSSFLEFYSFNTIWNCGRCHIEWHQSVCFSVKSGCMKLAQSKLWHGEPFQVLTSYSKCCNLCNLYWNMERKPQQHTILYQKDSVRIRVRDCIDIQKLAEQKLAWTWPHDFNSLCWRVLIKSGTFKISGISIWFAQLHQQILLYCFNCSSQSVIHCKPWFTVLSVNKGQNIWRYDLWNKLIL